MTAPPPPLSFSYARSLAPMLWVMVALSVAELLIIHLLVALLGSPLVALIFSAATLAAILWLVLLIRSFAARPVLVEPESVVMRVGFLWTIDLPREGIAAVRSNVTGEESRSRSVLNLALLAFPNVIVEMAVPVPFGRRGRQVRAVAHRLDEPSGFCAAFAPAEA